MSAFPLPSPSVAALSLCADGATAGDDRSNLSSPSPSVASDDRSTDCHQIADAKGGDAAPESAPAGLAPGSQGQALSQREGMAARKTSILKVTFEEVTLAADLWDAGAPLKTIADRLWWTDDLLNRVMRVAREAPDPGYFPEFPYRRPKQSVPCGAAVSAGGGRALPPDTVLWRAYLEQQGIAASTVAARRVADHLPPDRFVDPTLCLPPEPVAVSTAADPAPDALTLPSHPGPGLPGDGGGDGDGGTVVTLLTRTRHQCPFPLWPHSARPGDAGYGHVCGRPVAPTGRARRGCAEGAEQQEEGPEGGASKTSAYCKDHAKLASATRSETAKHERMNRAAVNKARSLGVA